jgi:hypothetical protein
MNTSNSPIRVISQNESNKAVAMSRPLDEVVWHDKQKREVFSRQRYYEPQFSHNTTTSLPRASSNIQPQKDRQSDSLIIISGFVIAMIVSTLFLVMWLDLRNLALTSGSELNRVNSLINDQDLGLGIIQHGLHIQQEEINKLLNQLDEKSNILELLQNRVNSHEEAFQTEPNIYPVIVHSEPGMNPIQFSSVLQTMLGSKQMVSSWEVIRVDKQADQERVWVTLSQLRSHMSNIGDRQSDLPGGRLMQDIPWDIVLLLTIPEISSWQNHDLKPIQTYREENEWWTEEDIQPMPYFIIR